MLDNFLGLNISDPVGIAKSKPGKQNLQLEMPEEIL